MRRIGYAGLLLAMALGLGCNGRCGAARPLGGAAQTSGALGEMPPAAAPATSATSEDTWAQVRIAQVHAGYVHTRRTVTRGQVHTQAQSLLRVKRAEVRIEMTSLSVAVETEAGQPLSFSVNTSGAGAEKRVTGQVGNGVARIEVTTAGAAHVHQISWPAGCLLPEGLRLRALREGLQAGTRYAALVFDFETLSCQETAFVVVGTENAPMPEGPLPAYLIRSEQQTQGGIVQVDNWVDGDQRPLMSQMQLMGVRFETIVTDAAAALQNHEGPELFTRSFIPAPRALRPVERQETRTYGLQSIQAAAAPQLPTTLEQQVDTDAENMRVTVSLRPVPPGDPLGTPVTDPDVQPYLQANAWIQSDAAEMRALSVRAVQGARTQGVAAQRIERFVAQYMSSEGSLAVGYASALETLHSRQGDCTEYALLTAALCRAAGIPARIALGIVYAENPGAPLPHFFGGHAWTQVFVAGHWYSLDAAQRGFGSGHIAFAHSDGDPESLMALIHRIGNLRVLSVE